MGPFGHLQVLPAPGVVRASDDGEHYFNSVVALGEKGPEWYDKSHLVPFAEFSATDPPDNSALVGASLTSLTLMVKLLSSDSPV